MNALFHPVAVQVQAALIMAGVGTAIPATVIGSMIFNINDKGRRAPRRLTVALVAFYVLTVGCLISAALA